MKFSFASREELVKFFDEEVLTTAQAMELLNVNRSRISSLIRDGKLEPIKKEKSISLFLRIDIEKKKKELEELRKKYRPYDN
ncbi:helix-turn-helix domain-containing protein [Alkalihalobacillus sp. LMS39]|uniref:helix-turn-helix domain-containing protein n=1 Tax=Alkalihalobacillus sp. LMS39 TaxID=2924032 RepID=UPI001FB347C1|nr:helix-turn-helix domain-containing protein [Alkalihalobacillus sp. LMS39]UOE96086.1 helix-turn-helix domain-containing protein [Alkalihalobacillus sp. LMS39]